MNDQDGSPRRRHILTSFNPEPSTLPKRRTPSASPTRSRPSKATGDKTELRFESTGHHGPDDKTKPRRSRLKLKDERSSRRRHRSRSRESRHSSRRDRDDAPQQSSRSHRHDRHRCSRHHRSRRSPTPPNPHEEAPLDPEVAFRESLFDAMADDEGALYWEAVYGQPVHVYSNERLGPEGELERMTEDEYATYVRQKMWEKTNAGLLEERAKREEKRKKKAEEDKTRIRLQREMEESLARGEERRKRKRWTQRWAEYNEAWANWDGSSDSLPWPLESGQRSDIEENSVRAFFVNGLDVESIGEKEFFAKLKDERVRWHPDKVQQKMGAKFDDSVSRGVTEIFQIIDRLWAEMRKG